MLEKTKGVWREFREFALKGNAMELAVAVLLGTAFGAIITSLTTDILGPFIALATGSVDFKTWSVVLRPDLVIRYGNLLQAVFNFLVVAVSIFIILKVVRLVRRPR